MQILPRFALFVDGSNLFGTMKHLGLRVEDYGAFYRFIFERAVDTWKDTLLGAAPSVQLRRVYWYVVGEMDQWDLASPKAQVHLRERFEDDKDVKRTYMALAGQKLKGESQEKVAKEAWGLCFSEFEQWYKRKQDILNGMKRFHHAIQSATDFIDVRECGRWKVDLIHQSLDEKGIDTSLAVDMVALQENYDIAIVLSGDADSIPSINYVKTRNKLVASVEFHKGYPPEKKGKNFAAQLNLAADFVVHVYEMDLVSKKVAVKGDPAELAPALEKPDPAGA